MRKNNIILIGMPGAGKSTIGILLAKALGMEFIDTDVAIQVREGKTLQSIVDQHGYLRLREIEQEVILQQTLHGAVVATGGSAVYGTRAMDYLTGQGVIVFIDVPIEQLRKRINNFDDRGIARQPGQDFESLYRERVSLYQQYADITITIGEQSSEQVLAIILSKLKDFPAA